MRLSPSSAPSVHSRLHTFRNVTAGTTLALLLAFLFAAPFAASVFVFGPQTYVRHTGTPVRDARTFKIAHPTNPYALRVVNHGVTSATISFNGTVLFSPDNF